jgi:cobalt-zinc-cadmium efflux system membrane fusion protein
VNDSGSEVIQEARSGAARTRLYAVLGVGVAIAAVGAVLLVRSSSAEGVRQPAATVAARPAAPAAEPAAAGRGDAERSAVTLRPEAAASNPIKTVAAAQARLAGDIRVVGNVSYDANRFAIVGPLVAGRVAHLHVGVGSKVRRAQVMAEIESAEVGEARAAQLSATARLAAAEANLRRERDLAEKRISSSREREVAEAQWATEKASLRAAHERLRAIGLSEADIRAMEAKDLGGRVAMRAPIAGTVIERLVTLGEAVERATDAFKIADLSHVWVLLDLYEKDLARVHAGQSVEVRTDAYLGEVFRGRVAYVVPVIDEATRTAKVRVEIENLHEKLRLGQLVTATLIGDTAAVAGSVLAVPRSAVQRVDGKPLVFVKRTEGFERRTVEIGVSGGDLVEVRSGLSEGEIVASEGGFLLKSELLR